MKGKATMGNMLQAPFSDIVGETSPIQKTIKIFWKLAVEKPETTAGTMESKSSAALILTHLLGLMDTAGFTNCRGFHSAAITLLRAIEDATDCYAAVGVSSDATLRWMAGKLRGSDAAKIWTPNRRATNIENMGEYRKYIRAFLNNYSHCSPEQTHWNVYLESTSNNRCTMELNTDPKVINLNAYYIDRYLCVHIYELVDVVFMVYEKYLEENISCKNELITLQHEIEDVVKDFLQYIESEQIDISVAPEISRIKS